MNSPETTNYPDPAQGGQDLPGEGRDNRPGGGGKNKKGLWALLAGLFLLLSKFKFGLVFLFSKLKFVLVFLNLGKFLTTFGSMLLMVWIYARFYGWVFGIGFVLLIFIHEMGHFLTARRVGLKVSAPLFIPFVGAFISMKETTTGCRHRSYCSHGRAGSGNSRSLPVCGLLSHNRPGVLAGPGL